MPSLRRRASVTPLVALTGLLIPCLGMGAAPDRPTSDAVLNVGGAIVGEAFGNSVTAGDFDGDGFGDLAVGSQFAGPNNAGRAYVYFGPDGSRSTFFDGEVTGDQFGFCVGNAGDMNFDGADELVVGANLNDAGGDDAGRAYVFNVVSGERLHTLTGLTAPSEFGWSVNGAGDINRDGQDDIIVGALTSSVGAPAAGSAYVFSGANGELLHSFHGTQPDELFGWRVVCIGDLNGDIFEDIAVSAPRFDGPQIDSGRVTVFSGVDGSVLRKLNGLEFDELFGFGLTNLGDVDGDLVPDIAVGAAFNGEAGTHAGRVAVISGATGSEITAFTGEAVADKFGANVARGGDIDGDGVPDLIVGAPGNDADPAAPIDHTGRAYAISIARNEIIGTVTGTNEMDWLGWACAGGEDFDADGLCDMFLGAPLASRDIPLAGRAFVVLSEPVLAPCPADFNGDGVVNGSDLATLLGNWGGAATDLTDDGVTDGADLAALLAVWQTNCS